MISRFALIENSYGSPEEAQTLFEHVLTSYPSRIDVWSIYVDMLIKSNKIDLAR
jgi:rRNA biogenesis protein RRP5